MTGSTAPAYIECDIAKTASNMKPENERILDAEPERKKQREKWYMKEKRRVICSARKRNGKENKKKE